MVLFGAGKVGRSFIAQLFNRAGYEVVFVDIDHRVIDALNKRGEYDVVIKSDTGDEVIKVRNVRGLLATDEEKVAEELATADIAATAVGKNALLKIAPLIAAGLAMRHEKYGNFPLDIILAENLRDAAETVHAEVQKHLPEGIKAEDMAGLVETSIGKMVPIMPAAVNEHDPLTVWAEPYNILILDKRAFKNKIPEVEGLAPKEHMKAWVDRKLFIHNLGHAAAAYYGNFHYPDKRYMWEIMAHEDVRAHAHAAMEQAADALIDRYPHEFMKRDLDEHIDDLLRRFANKALGDTVFRVGRDLYRKLAPDDRLVFPLRCAYRRGLLYDKILESVACALHFSATDEQGSMPEGDVQFLKEAQKGLPHILENVCKLDRYMCGPVYQLAENMETLTQKP